ncbi:MAG: hypothetical protein J6Y24_13440 [Bacteroidales bacterium]|nr:hypothetical protein [Bacteroidales bacterium]
MKNKTNTRIYTLIAIVFLLLTSANAWAQNNNETQVNSIVDDARTIARESQGATKEVPAERRLANAIETARKVKEMANYIDKIKNLAENRQIPLPIGIKSNLNDYEIVVQQLSHESDSVAKAYMTLVIPVDSATTIGFETYISLSGSCGPQMPGRLKLIRPVEMHFGDKFKITFNNGSYAEFDCDGITQFHMDVTLEFVANSIKFYDENMNPLQKPKFNTKLTFNDFSDFVFDVNAKLAFEFPELQDFLFYIEDITVDFSEFTTPKTAAFPPGYFGSDDDRNLWRGLAVKKAQLYLPPALKTDQTSISDPSKVQVKKVKNEDRTSIVCSNLVIDRHGITVDASVEQLCRDCKVEPAKWDLKVSLIGLSIVKNKIKGAGFSGILNIPPFGEYSKLGYSAEYNIAEKAFDFKCDITGNHSFDVFGATLNLNEHSYIEIALKNGGFYPTISASGSIKIDAPLSEGGMKLQLPEIAFEGMKIRREKPVFEPGVWDMSALSDVEMPKIAGFEFALSNISQKDESISFDAMVSLNGKITGEGSFEVVGDFDKYKIKHVNVSKIAVEYRQPFFGIRGEVQIKRGDEIYGNGFRGKVDLSLMDDWKFEAVTVFGKKDQFKYFLVDVYGEKKSGLFTIPPCITVQGLGGGVYHRMNQTVENNDFGKALSGICYVPDKSVGFGFLAHARFFVGQENAVNAKTSFDIQFNEHWGLNYFQINGDLAFMNMPENLNKFKEGVLAKVKDIQSKDGIGKLHLNTPDDLKIPEKTNGSVLSASILMKFDATNKTFFADLKTYLNAGFIEGTGPNKLMVEAKALFGTKDWYIHMGSPDKPCGIRVLKLMETNSYFMLGNQIPPLPNPPAEVWGTMDQAKRDKYLSAINDDKLSSLSTGQGVAFGLNFKAGASINPVPFYADFNVGAGIELLLEHYKNAHCKGSSNEIGIKGWYAKAQMWAYLNAAVGLKVKVFRKERKFSIAELHAGAVMTGMGPNPFYFVGNLNASYSLLGGLVKGDCSLDLEIGTPCELRSGNDLLGESILSALTPSDGDSDVNVFASPQAVLNIPVDHAFEMLDENDRLQKYIIQIAEYTVTDITDGKPIDGKRVVASDGLTVVYNPTEPFDTRHQYKVYIKVLFKQKSGNTWLPVKGDDGADYFEDMTATFKSGERPTTIDSKHIICSYPENMMYNYYKNQCTEGYICLMYNYQYLFREKAHDGFKQKIVVTNKKGYSKEIDFATKFSSEVPGEVFEITFNLKDLELENNTVYQLELMNIPLTTVKSIDQNVEKTYTKVESNNPNENIEVRHTSATGTLNQLETKTICTLHFRTSRFNKFSEKIKSMDIINGDAVDVGEDSWRHSLSVNITSNDFFDGIEWRGTANIKPLISFNIDLENTKWYTGSIYKQYYSRYHLSDGQQNRIYNFPPTDAIQINNNRECNHNFFRLENSEIETGRPSGLFPEGSIHYCALYQFDDDIRETRINLLHRCEQNLPMTPLENSIVEYEKALSFSSGKYPYKIIYSLPGKNTVLESVDANFIYKE